MAIYAAKQSLRKQLKDAIRSISPEEKAHQSNIVINKLFQSSVYRNSKKISVYLSRDIEVDTKEILKNIFSSKKECYIPKYDSKSTNMEMVKLNSLKDFDNLPETSWKIKQPLDSDTSREDAISTGGLDLIIVPGIGFTKNGDRIGNGKGYYDIYLNQYREKLGRNISTIALAFREQIVPSIPTSEHDIKIDQVLYPD